MLFELVAGAAVLADADADVVETPSSGTEAPVLGVKAASRLKAVGLPFGGN